MKEAWGFYVFGLLFVLVGMLVAGLLISAVVGGLTIAMQWCLAALGF